MVKVISSSQNRGFATGHNLGVAEASGTYILLLNNDTWLEEHFLECLLENFLHSGVHVIAPFEAAYDEQPLPRYVRTVDLLGHPLNVRIQGAGDANNHPKNFYLPGVCLLTRRRFYEETGGLDGDFFMYFEETDWCWRLHLQGYRLGYADLDVHHAGATVVGIKYQAFLWRNQNALQMLLKNYQARSLAWVIPLYLLQNLAEMAYFLLTFRPKIVATYPLGWWFNLRYLRRTLAKRREIQQHRQVSDAAIRQKMYIGFGKLQHLRNYGRGDG